jgi:hypothetical protein
MSSDEDATSTLVPMGQLQVSESANLACVLLAGDNRRFEIGCEFSSRATPYQLTRGPFPGLRRP